jgi:hypothetical protein
MVVVAPFVPFDTANPTNCDAMVSFASERSNAFVVVEIKIGCGVEFPVIVVEARTWTKSP